MSNEVANAVYFRKFLLLAVASEAKQTRMLASFGRSLGSAQARSKNKGASLEYGITLGGWRECLHSPSQGRRFTPLREVKKGVKNGYLSLPIEVCFDEDTYIARCALFQGAFAEGETPQEAIKEFMSVIEMLLEMREQKEFEVVS